MQFFCNSKCPICKYVDGWALHAWYCKYHGNGLIVIIRLRCLGCKKTHAVIPAFSLPHTSLDTETVQTYIAHREAGESRPTSAKASGFPENTSTDFLRSLEKRLTVAVVRAKALYPGWGNEHQNGYSWMVSAASGAERTLFILNARAIKSNGQSFFGGNVMTGLRNISSGIAVSHKKDTT